MKTIAKKILEQINKNMVNEDARIYSFVLKNGKVYGALHRDIPPEYSFDKIKYWDGGATVYVQINNSDSGTSNDAAVKKAIDIFRAAGLTVIGDTASLD